MGSWLSYGLGSMNKDLPDFIVLTSAYWSGGRFNIQGLYSRLWGSGPLPTKHQGVAQSKRTQIFLQTREVLLLTFEGLCLI